MPMAVVWAAMATAGALALAGRFAEVTDVAAQGVQATKRCDSGPQRYGVGLAEILAFTEAGNITAAIEVCAGYAALAAGVPEADAIVKALSGRVELARGRLAEACEALQTALWTMAEVLPAGWVMLAASWLAQAEGARANVDGAAAALARAEEANGPQVAVFGPELDLARSWDRACSGETTAARDHAMAAARVARNAGMHAVEMRALHTAVRFGGRSHSTRLRQLAAQIDTPMAMAIAAHSQGIDDHDGDRLDYAADRFAELGTPALAADALAQASREHAHAGARVKELESATRAHWLASQCGLRTPALRSVEDPLPITDREREIASLVGAGLTNREIADRLGVSVRTVDGHLYRVFSKLRIADRDQLARLVRIRSAT
jgi:DNA-binding CsgD family transcriptional regulator